jgi:hypothetical protein
VTLICMLESSVIPDLISFLFAVFSLMVQFSYFSFRTEMCVIATAQSNARSSKFPL